MRIVFLKVLLLVDRVERPPPHNTMTQERYHASAEAELHVLFLIAPSFVQFIAIVRFALRITTCFDDDCLVSCLVGCLADLLIVIDGY